MAGGGVKINNIKVIGGANGKTPRVKIEGTNLYVSYDNQTWTDMGRVVGAKGQDGATGAKIVSQNLVMIDSNGGYVYKQKFDDGTETTFTAPKGEKGNAGVGIAVGGTTGQFLVKKSEEDYNTEWKSISYVEEEDYERNILSLYSIVEGSGIVTNTEVEDSYHSRKTAGGLNIIDKSISRVSKISGNTISSKNLIPYPYAANPNVTFHGVTFKTNSDGSVQVNGTPDGTSGITYSLVSYNDNYILPVGTYSVSGGSENCVLTVRKLNNSTGQDESWINSAANVGVGTLTEPTKVSIQFYIAKTVTTNLNTLRYPMLNEGSAALPYYQYFSGLKNAGFKSILNTGKNLVNTDGLFDVGTSYGGLTCSKNEDGTYKLRGTATQSFWYGVDRTSTACYIPQGATIYFTPYYDITTTATGSYKLIGIALYDKDGKLVKQWNSGISSGTVTSFVVTRDVVKVAFVWNISGSAGLAVTIDNIKFMLSYENTNVFEPYKSDSIACESNLDLAEFDYVVPSENKVYRQSETITFDGSNDESWTFLTYNSTFISGGITHAPITSLTEGIVANMPDVKWTLTDINSKIELPSSSVGNVTTEGDLRTYLATHNLVVTYKKNSVTTENVSFDKADYTAYLNGSESVLSDEDAVYPIITQSYYVKEGV